MKQRCTSVHQCVTSVCIDFPRELPVRKSHHVVTQTPSNSYRCNAARTEIEITFKKLGTMKLFRGCNQ